MYNTCLEESLETEVIPHSFVFPACVGGLCTRSRANLIQFSMAYDLFSSDQEERQWAIREFKEGRKDVLVATDVASKGLDFPNIQHIINYDMPNDIENYGVCVCVYVCVCVCVCVCACACVWRHMHNN